MSGTLLFHGRLRIGLREVLNSNRRNAKKIPDLKAVGDVSEL